MIRLVIPGRANGRDPFCVSLFGLPKEPDEDLRLVEAPCLPEIVEDECVVQGQARLDRFNIPCPGTPARSRPLGGEGPKRKDLEKKIDRADLFLEAQHN